jgi:hypothetical protein
MWQLQMTLAPSPFRPGASPTGLRVVQDDDVAGGDLLSKLLARLLERLLVHIPFRPVEAVAVAGMSIQQVVEALGDFEEPLVTADHDPADVDPYSGEIARVGTGASRPRRRPARWS